MKDLHLFLLAGGQSRRFKTASKRIDKAFLKDEKWGDVPLLINAIKLFQDMNSDFTVIVNDNERKQEYSEIIRNYGLKNIDIIVDNPNFSMKGPLNSMLTAFEYSEKMYQIFYPLDMPYLIPQLVNLLYSYKEKGIIISFIYPDGKIEPLFSLYNRRRWHPLVINKINSYNKNRPSDLFRGSETLYFISVNEVLKFDPTLKSFININEPDSVKLTSLKIPRNINEFNSFQLVKNPISREIIDAKIREIQDIKEIYLSYYWIASYLEYLTLNNPEKRVDYLKLAIKYYTEEKKIYEKYKLNFLSRHVALDIEKCKEKSLLNK